SGAAVLQVVGSVPIVDGEIAAELRESNLAPDVATAAVDVARGELVLQVRTVFAEILARGAERELRLQGTNRLRAYTDLISIRKGAGALVTGQQLSARARLIRDVEV